MSLTRALAWGLFLLYAVWAAALQGWLASPQQLGEWTPDLGLILLCAWAGRLRAEGPPAALVVALARAGFGAADPAALAGGTLAAVGVFAGLRVFLEIDRAVPRAILCGLVAWLAAGLLLGARSVALAVEASTVAVEGVRLWPGALASACACLALVPLLRRLPGLESLARSRP